MDIRETFLLIFQPATQAVVPIRLCSPVIGHRASVLDSEWLPWSEELVLDGASAADFGFLGLYSVMTTVTLLTVTSRVCAELLSMFFNLGGCRRFARDLFSFLSFLALDVAGTYCCATCWATSCGLMRGFRVDVPLRTSHIRHLNASAELRNVHTLQSQKLSSRTFAWRFVRRMGLFLSIL